MRERPDRTACLLVVDDDDDIRFLLSEQLQTMGYEVCESSNGREALDLISRKTIDGMLVDVRMPIMDGWTLLERLQEQHVLFPIIVMSADGPDITAPLAREYGAAGYLPKPFTFSHLRTTCFRVFGELSPSRVRQDSRMLMASSPMKDLLPKSMGCEN